jgi:hypothetical protein
MSSSIKHKLSPIPAQFAQYSETLAYQINEMWWRSSSILLTTDKPIDRETDLTKSIMRKSTTAILKVMPYLLNGLDEPFRSEFIETGLQSLDILTLRDKFELAFNKQATLHFDSKVAATADIGLSNLLAMYFTDPDLKPRPHELHLKFKAFSPVLARQIADLNERANFEDGKSFTLLNTTLRKSILSLSQIIPFLLSNLPEDTIKKIELHGLDSLDDQSIANLVEYTGMNEIFRSKLNLETKFDDALTNLRSMHFNVECTPFSHLKFKDSIIDISRAMQLSYTEFCDVKKLLSECAEIFAKDENKSTQTSIDNLNKSLNCILKLLNGELSSCSEEMTIKEKITSQSALVIKITNKMKSDKSAFMVFLKNIAPEHFGEQRIIQLNTDEKFDEFTANISKTFKEEYKAYLSEYNNYSAVELWARKSLAKYLYAHYEDPKLKKVLMLLQDHGINGLALEYGKGFNILNEHLENTAESDNSAGKWQLTAALEIYNFTNKTSIRLNQLSPFIVTFENENNDRLHSISLYEIATDYPRVFEDLKIYIDKNKTKTDEGSVQQITLSSKVNIFKRLFLKYHNSLNESEISTLKSEGMQAFAKNNKKLLEHFRQLILNDSKNKIIKSSTAIQQQNALNSIVDFFGIDKSEAYRVKANKDQKLARRRNQKSMYTFEQVVNIAYAIEKLLTQTDLTNLQHLCLHAARIFIKTGWNLTPVLELDRDDLTYFGVSLQGNRTAAVRMFKRRANYKTHWPTFGETAQIEKIDADTLDREYVTGKITSAVMQDLEFISNHTRKTSEQHKKTQFRDKIFTYSLGKKVSVLNGLSFTKCINELLKKAGLDITFSVTRLRKKGMNYTYRKVAKNFEKYKHAGLHTPAAFYQYYLKMESGESEQSISAATAVMADFYIHDNAEKIIFVQKVDDSTRQTPTGRCNQTADSDVVKQFKVKNRKFLDEKEITGCADFGACLFCEHFRCIADAEHVWRLLSFEKIVIEQMVAASYSIFGDDGSEQQKNIIKLKQRVIDILKELEHMNSQAISQGKVLFSQHGVHPDWEFA